MKVKQKSVCQTCRTRKLGCDGKRPGCSQCVHSGHKCSGYQTDWKFVSHTPIHTSTSGEQHGQARTARKEDRETLSGADQQEDLPSTGPMQLQHPLNQPSASNHTELITQSFVPGSGRITPMYDSDYMEPRICGSWVEVLSNLPCLTTKNSVLPNAVTALAASIPSQPRISNITCLQTYHTAIRTLRESFCVNRLTLDIEQIPAIMCLTLVEIMIPDSVAAMTSHTQAVGLLLQAYGPGLCKNGLLHRLFVGFRPLLTIQAFRCRQPTFLAYQPWIDTPFSIFRPSLMQSLLSEAIILPALLHESDWVLKNLAQRHFSDINEMVCCFFDVLSRLDQWEKRLQKRDQPCYWPCGDATQPVESSASDDTRLILWYPNVTMANALTHLWAFRIVCLTEIKRFTMHDPFRDQEQPIRTGKLGLDFDDLQAQMIALAKKISLSMVYLLQDEMKLFGPASTFFPLRIANQTFKATEQRQWVDIAYLEDIVDQLDQKGLKSARALIFDD